MSRCNTESSEWSASPVFRPLLSSSSLVFTSMGTTTEEENRTSPSDSPPIEGFTSGNAKTGRIVTVFYACLVAVLGSFSIGYVLGFPSPALPDLDENEGKYTRMDKSIYHSMFNALMPIGALVGGLIAGWLVEYFGRQLSLMFSSVPMVVGWIMILTTHSIDGPLFRPLLFTGRFFTGVGAGCLSLNVPLYITEISPGKLRGLFGAMAQVAITLGIFTVEASGIGLEYEWLSVIALSVFAIFIPLITTLVETPRWLISKGRNPQAGKALLWLRGRSYAIAKEQREIEQQLASENKLSIWESFQAFKTKPVLHPMILALSLMFLQQFSGINAIIFNAQKIFEDSRVSNPAVVASLAIGGVQVVATFFGLLLTDVLGRKFLLITGGFVMACSMGGIGTYAYFTNKPYCHPDLSINGSATTSTGCKDNIQPLAIASMMFYIIGFSIGWGALPWILSSEIIPMRVRGVGMGIATFANFSFAAIVTGAFESYQKAIYPWGTFWSFGFICFLAIIFVAVFIPETKGKSLEEIERYFYLRHGKALLYNNI